MSNNILIKFFAGEKGKKMVEEIRSLLQKKYGRDAFGVESLFGAVVAAVFAFFIFPNYIKPVLEEVIDEMVKTK